MCVADDGTIGNSSSMPWCLPADIQRFKQFTMGQSLIMGRKTHASIDKPLMGRQNIVLSKQTDYQAPGCEIANSIDEAIALANRDEIFFIGGAEIFTQIESIADEAYVTNIHISPVGDIKYSLNPKLWQLQSKIDYRTDGKNKHSYSFLRYTRKPSN